MWIPHKLKRILDQQAKSTQYLAEIAAGSDNQQRLLNDKLTEAIVALNDISNELRSKLDAVASVLKSNAKLFDNKLDGMIAGLSNHAQLLNNQLDLVTKSRADGSRRDGGKLDAPSQRREGAASYTNRYIIKSVLITPNAVRVSWADGHESLYHHMWLRDNCVCDGCGARDVGIHFQQLLDIPDDIAPRTVEADASGLTITWANDGHRSLFTLHWLRDRCYSDAERARRHRKRSLWDSSLKEIPIADYRLALEEDAERYKLFSSVRECGFVLLKNVGTLQDEIERLGSMIGYIRETHGGRVSGGVTVHYNGKLLPHTDEIYRHVPIGVNIFHCIQPSLDGGGVSTLVDSFSVAAQLRAQDADAFALLSRVPIQHERRTDGQTIRSHNPVFTLDYEGSVTEVRLNERTMSTLSVPEELMESTYSALRKAFRIAYDPANLIQHRLDAGEALVFDNLRVLHGRTSFTGERDLRIAHVMRDEFYAQLVALEEARPGFAN